MTSQTLSFRHVVVLHVAVEVSADAAKSSIIRPVIRHLHQKAVQHDVIMYLTVLRLDHCDVTEVRLPHADVELDERKCSPVT